MILPQSIDAVVGTAAPPDTSSTMPHSRYDIVMDTSRIATPVDMTYIPDLSAYSNIVEVQDVLNIQDTNDDMVGDQLVYSYTATPLHHFTPLVQDS